MRKLISFARLTEVDGFSDALVRIYKADKAAAGDAYVKSAMAEIERLSAELTAAILQNRTPSNLEAADGVRCEAVRTLAAVLAGYAVFPDEKKRAAGTLLKAICDKYVKAGILSAGYLSKSSMTESMLEDFAAAAARKAVSALDGAEALVSALRSAQDAFAAASDAYVRARADRGKSASEIKMPLLAAINDRLVPYLNAMQIAKSAELAEFIKGAEAEIDRINEAVLRRSKRAASAQRESAPEGGEQKM